MQKYYSVADMESKKFVFVCEILSRPTGSIHIPIDIFPLLLLYLFSAYLLNHSYILGSKRTELFRTCRMPYDGMLIFPLEVPTK